MKSLNKSHKFIWNATDFRNTNFKNFENILGRAFSFVPLFSVPYLILILWIVGLMSYDHLSYEPERDPKLEPSLSELTRKAIEALSQNEKGFFLLVEGSKHLK